MVFALALLYFIVLSTIMGLFVKITARSFFIGLLSLLLLSAIQILNSFYNFIPEKIASFISYDAFKYDEFRLTFFVQYLLAWVPMQIFDFAYTSHSLNIAIQSLIFLIGAHFLFTENKRWQFLAFVLFLSYYHYSIFGVRDPIVALICMTIVVASIKFSLTQFYIYLMFSSFVCLGIRPEFSLVILSFGALRYYLASTFKVRVVLFLLGLVGLYGALLVMPYAFGISASNSVISNIETMINFNELRAARRAGGDGGNSHILSGNLFQYPFLVRYPIQVVASFVTPLPFEIRGSIFDLLAMIESILFCWVVYASFRMRNYSAINSYLFYCGLLYMFLQAIFAVNYGNILRMRYPLYIFFLASTLPLINFRANKRRNRG